MDNKLDSKKMLQPNSGDQIYGATPNIRAAHFLLIKLLFPMLMKGFSQSLSEWIAKEAASLAPFPLDGRSYYHQL